MIDINNSTARTHKSNDDRSVLSARSFSSTRENSEHIAQFRSQRTHRATGLEQGVFLGHFPGHALRDHQQKKGQQYRFQRASGTGFAAGASNPVLKGSPFSTGSLTNRSQRVSTWAVLRARGQDLQYRSVTQTGTRGCCFFFFSTIFQGLGGLGFVFYFCLLIFQGLGFRRRSRRCTKQKSSHR